jgi:hypothetical protein
LPASARRRSIPATSPSPAAYDDDGRIVLSGNLLGEDCIDQPFGHRCRRRMAMATDDVGEFIVAERTYAVARQHDPVARAQLQRRAVHVDEVDARAGKCGAQRMPVEMGFGFARRADVLARLLVEQGPERMVGVEADDLGETVEQQQGITNTGPAHPRRIDPRGEQRAAHAAQRRILLDPTRQRRVAGVQGRVQSLIIGGWR